MPGARRTVKQLTLGRNLEALGNGLFRLLHGGKVKNTEAGLTCKGQTSAIRPTRPQYPAAALVRRGSA
jgi:hypothetical protein